MKGHGVVLYLNNLPFILFTYDYWLREHSHLYQMKMLLLTYFANIYITLLQCLLKDRLETEFNYILIPMYSYVPSAKGVVKGSLNDL